MIGEPEREDNPFSDRAQALDEILTPQVRKALGDLALLSDKSFELSEVLAAASRTLALLAERHPELGEAPSALRAKMGQLCDAQSELGKHVMRYSHAYEDAVVAAGKLRSTLNGSES